MKRAALPMAVAEGVEGARTLGEVAYRRLRSDLVMGRLQPGQPLRFDALKEQYGLGVSPLREALSHLPPSCQQLISLFTEDPPPPYAEISARLGIPVGSIGPSRSRCLDKLRRHPAIAALINAEASAAPG